MTNEQLKDSLRRIFSSWKRKHKKIMTLNVGTGEGDMGFKFKEEQASIRDDERFLSILGWLLEKRNKLTVAQQGINERHIRFCEEETEKHLNKLFEYLDENYNKCS